MSELTANFRLTGIPHVPRMLASGRHGSSGSRFGLDNVPGLRANYRFAPGFRAENLGERENS